MNKFFAIPYEKTLLLKDRTLNNNNYGKVQVETKTYDFFERKSIIQNELEPFSGISCTADGLEILDITQNPIPEGYTTFTFDFLMDRVPKTFYTTINHTINDDYNFNVYSKFTQVYYSTTGSIPIVSTLNENEVLDIAASIRNKTVYKRGWSNFLTNENYDSTNKPNNFIIKRVETLAANIENNFEYFNLTNTSAGVDHPNYFKLENINLDTYYNGSRHELFFAYTIANNTLSYAMLLLVEEYEVRKVAGETYSNDYHYDMLNLYFYYNFNIQIQNLFTEQGTSFISTGNGQNDNSIILSTNDMINSITNINGVAIANDITSKTYNYYKNGIATISISLPIIPLYDLSGNQVTMLENNSNSIYIRVGDKFVITKNGLVRNNNQQFMVTSCKTRFEGRFRWEIEAKECEQYYEFETFSPKLSWGYSPVYHSTICTILNTDELLEMCKQKNIAINDLKVGIVIKRHCQKGQPHKINVYGDPYNVTMEKMHYYKADNNSYNYNFNLVYDAYSKKYYISQLTSLLSNTNFAAKRTKNSYYIYGRSKGRFANKLFVGICLKFENNYSEKSENCFMITIDESNNRSVSLLNYADEDNQKHWV